MPPKDDETRRSMEVAHGDATIDNESLSKSHTGSLDFTSSLDEIDSGSMETEQQQPSGDDGACELHHHPQDGDDGLVKKSDVDGADFPLGAHGCLKRWKWILLLGLAMASLVLFVSVTVMVAPGLLRGSTDDDDGDYHMEISTMHQENASIPEFIIEPLSEQHERHLQGLSCGAVSGDNNNERTCSFQGVMRFTDAMKLYRTFCPHWPGSRVCARSGMPTVKLTCNGHQSTLFGGARIPAEPPKLDKDPAGKSYALFPAADKGYFAIQDVKQRDGSACSHVFEGGMYCYVDKPQTCFVWAGWQPGNCGGSVSLCG